MSQSISDTKDAVDAIAEEITPLAEFSDDAGNSGVAGFVAKVDDHAAVLGDIAKWQTTTTENIAAVTSTANATASEVVTLAASVGENKESIASVKNYADDTFATIEAVTAYQDGTDASIAGVSATVDAYKAELLELVSKTNGEVETLAASLKEVTSDYATSTDLLKYQDDTAKAFTETTKFVTDNYATQKDLLALETATAASVKTITASLEEVTKDYATQTELVSYQTTTTDNIAAINKRADGLSSSIETLATQSTDNADLIASLTTTVTNDYATNKAVAKYQEETTQSITQVKQTAESNKTTIESVGSVVTETSTAVSNISQQVTDTNARIDKLVNFRAEDVEALSAVSNKVDANSASITELNSFRTTTEESITSIEATASAQGAKITELAGWQTAKEDVIAGVITTADNNAANITSLTEWKEEANQSITAIDQKASANEANITTLAAWKDSVNSDVSSIAEVKQTANANKASIESIATWQGGIDTAVQSIASIEQTVGEHESKISTLTTWQSGVNTSVTSLDQRATANEANIKSVAAVSNEAKSAVSTLEQKVTTEYATLEYVGTLEGSDNSKAIAELRLEVAQNYVTNAVMNAFKDEQQQAQNEFIQEANNKYATTAQFNTFKTEQTNAQNAFITTANDTYAKSSELTTFNNNLAAVTTTANKAGARIEQVVSAIGKDGNVTAASIVTTVNNAGSDVAIKADKINFEGFTTFAKSSQVDQIAEVTNNNATTISSWCKDNNSTLIDGAHIATGTIDAAAIKADTISALSLEVGKNVTLGPDATIDWGKVTNKDNVANKGDIPTSEQITTISKNAITSEFITGLNLEVGNQIKMGPNATISWDKVSGTDGVATTTDVNNAKSAAVSSAVQEVAGKGYQTADQVTQITKNTVTSSYIEGLELKVGKEIQMGADATISWDKVAGRPTNLATTTDVENAAADAVSSAVSEIVDYGYQTAEDVEQYVTDQGYQTANDVETYITRQGFPTEKRVTEITNESISTCTINANQINADDLSAVSAQVAGWNLDADRIYYDYNEVGMSSNSDYAVFWAGYRGADGPTDSFATNDEWRSLTNFYVTADGYLRATNADIEGTITATAGTIGGWNIEEDMLYIDDGETYSGMAPFSDGGFDKNGNDVGCVFFAGARSYAGDGATFYVTPSGEVHATDAYIEGGQIGNWSISGDTLFYSDDNETYSGMNPGGVGGPDGDGAVFFAGAHNSQGDGAVFCVDNYGKLTASDADITGNITTSSGTIGGWHLDRQYVPSGPSSGTTDYALYTDEMYEGGYTYQVYLTAKGVYVSGRSSSGASYFANKTWRQICGG